MSLCRNRERFHGRNYTTGVVTEICDKTHLKIRTDCCARVKLYHINDVSKMQ